MAKKLDKVDVVIIGSGWSGGIVAAELAKKGYQVVGLERGKDQSIEDFIGAKDELRYTRRSEMTQDLTIESFTVRNTLDESAIPIRGKAGFNIGTNTGGMSAHWTGVTFRWLPFDFEIKSKLIEKYGKDIIPKDMTIQDWGITYDELEKYYDQFEKTAGVAGEDNPLGPERSDEYPNPPVKETPSVQLFQEAAKELGYHPYRLPSANADQDYENPDGETINACVYCAFCTLHGCDFGAKADPIVTVLKTAKKTNNYELRNAAYAKRILHDGERATGVLYVDTETGEEYEQPADLVVSAAFTFTNTKLLLLSEIGEPYDVKTGKGIIGKNYTGHHTNIGLIGATGFFEDKKFNNFAGAGALGATIDDYNPEQLDHLEEGFLHGYEVYILQEGNPPISGNNVPEGTPLWGKEFKEKSLHYANRQITLAHQYGSLPWNHNFLDLDPNYTDAFGDPLLRITCKYTDHDRNINRQALETSKEILEQMGADIIQAPEITDETEFSGADVEAHSAGGVIMGEDAETSAVNSYSQMWDMENLFVVGASSFPHFGHHNPTGTVGAMAYRAAEGMIKYLEEGGGLLVEAKDESRTV